MSLIYSNNQPGFKIEAIYQHCHSGGSSITQHLSINLCIIVETRTSVYKRKYGELIVLQQTYLINTLELRVSLIYLTSDLALRDADIGWISAARSQFDIRPFKFDFWISSNIPRYHQIPLKTAYKYSLRYTIQRCPCHCKNRTNFGQWHKFNNDFRYYFMTLYMKMFIINIEFTFDVNSIYWNIILHYVKWKPCSVQAELWMYYHPPCWYKSGQTCLMCWHAELLILQ